MTTATEGSAVVAGVDGSATALDAARWAAEFAVGHALPLTLVHAIPRIDWHFTNSEQVSDLDRSGHGDRVLAEAEAAVRSTHPGLAVSAVAVKGAVAKVLTDAAQSARILVVGCGDADHRTLGGHAVRITHRAQCPVVVWRKPVARRTGKPLPVIVGIDESDNSTRALAEAFDIAAMLHAPLTVVHMWEIAQAVGMGDLGGQGAMDWQLLELLQSQQRAKMDELVAPLAGRYRNAHVNKVFQDISPVKGLTDLSREAQLVVVGSHGRGGFTDSLLGSVSQSLIHHAECPVLVVR